MPTSETESLRIDSLSYGRAGIGRLGGRVVFVEETAPGDRIRVALTGDHGSWAQGRMVELSEAGDARVEPPCPLAGSCGGCPWQHVDYRVQLESKEQAVRDALTRIAGIESPPVEPILASPRREGYRNRLKLRFENGRLGFYRAATHRLVELDDCLIADERIRASMTPIGEFVGSLATRATRVEIAVRGELPGLVVAINSSGRLRAADRERIKAFLSSEGNPVRGLVMFGRGWRRSWGDTRRRFALDETGTTAQSAGTAFGQINTEGNRILVDLALAMLAPKRSQQVLDLYAGAGNFSLPIARHAGQVFAVESDADAVAAGRESASFHGLSGLRFVERRVERYLAAAPAVVQSAIVNPPRSGLLGSADLLGRLGIPRIVYVSCDPTTLARDLKTLAVHGYRLERAAPVDMFPHTFHVETVCGLTCC